MSSRGDSTACCGARGWMLTAVVSIVLALCAVAGLIAVAVLRDCQNEDNCIAKCKPCYRCLAQYTGQDTESICTVSSTSTNAQCTEQVYYLYRQNNTQNNIPCYSDCQECRDCISETRTEDTDLQSTLWETVFPSYFDAAPGTESESDEDNEEDEDDDSTGNTTITVGRRRKRQITYTADGDACCRTERRLAVYQSTYLEPRTGITWHPVWFHKSWASPPYLYQLYDEIRCPQPNPNCGTTSMTCREQSQTKSLLMSRDIPHPQTGYTYIILHYPSTQVKFIDLQLPCYCRCTL